jgi:hypothetical protein
MIACVTYFIADPKLLRLYKRMRELVYRWIGLATELAILRIETNDRAAREARGLGTVQFRSN